MILNQFYIATLLLLFSNFNLLFYKIIKIKKNNLYIKNGIVKNQKKFNLIFIYFIICNKTFNMLNNIIIIII